MRCHALIIHIASFENVQGFTELRNKQKKNESNTLDWIRWRNKRKQVCKRNQHCDVNKRKSQVSI